MSSLNNNEAIQSNDNTTCPNMLRFVNVRSFATAAKKFVSKIKSVRIFCSRSSTYAPFHVWEAQYLSENPQFETDITKVDTEADSEESKKGVLATVSHISKDAQIEDEHQIVLSESIRAEPVGNVPVADADQTCDEQSVKEEVHETREPDVQTILDITTVKEIRRVSQELMRFDSLPSTESPSNPVVNVHADMNETTFSHQNAEQFCNATSECISRPPASAEQAAPDPKKNQSQLSSETVGTVVSDNMDQGVVHKCENENGETVSNPANDPQPSSSESYHVQIECNDSDVTNMPAEESLMDEGGHDDTSAALTSTARGSGAEISCQTPENIVDHVEPSQTVERCKTSVLESALSCELPKSEIKSFDPEKAERKQRLRRRIALKKEARLRRAKEYAARETEKNTQQCLEGLKGKLPSTASTIVSDRERIKTASKPELKAEREKAGSTEKVSESARWSKQYAEEVRERRKRNQKERLLNLMELCITKN